MADNRRLIDANALVKKLAKSHEYHARNCREEVLLYRDIRIINEQPTVEAVPVVHSSWILNDDGSGTCKHCNRTTKSCWDFDNQMHYCPNCGANMMDDERSN